ncbi:lipoyl(octanoyl) transferase [Nakamurella sp. UYEF19]|uniref:lipoyl(octanoyl) transferase LipB n=1 Tax=Nakamurella sp. UYEF19 TaxID=1756392 RepID=UPI003398F680
MPDPTFRTPDGGVNATRQLRAQTTAVRFVEAGEVDYQQAWDHQRALAVERAEDRAPDTVLMLTHPSVYTAGRRTEAADRPTDGTPVIDVDRGGRITWHGPGQLVGYPLIRLADPIDVIAYVRLLEQALIQACGDLGLSGAERVSGRSGVWLVGGGRPDRKIAAIGVRIARGVTTHGFALNCDPDLGAYHRIVPCGIRDATVTSLTEELGRHVTVGDAVPVVTRRLQQAFDGELVVGDTGVAATSGRRETPTPPGIQWHLDTVLAPS